MSSHRLRLATGLTALLSAIALALGAAGAFADTAGTVHFVRMADPAFAPYTDNPSVQTQAWLRAHFWRMTAFSPYFDQKTSWFPRGWAYQDAFAIYPGSALASQHPEWILRDSSGNKLYIPYACSGGTCPAYAGDISNPAFRHNWIEEARAKLAHGYAGLFIDDVDMEERVGNGNEQELEPIDPHSGRPMPPSSWRSYMAEFMAEVRAAFPSSEIVHNLIWFADSHAGTSDPSIRREIESANYVYLERGVNDSGLTSSTGPWSIGALFSFVDQVHALGRGVVLDGASGEPQGIEYNLASYFLISTGNDAVSSAGQTPSNWWPGFEVNLGEATDARYSWHNLLRRDFSGGMALVNPAGSATQTVTLPSPMQTVTGNSISSVTLQGGSGIVLRGAAPSETTAPASAPVGVIATETIVTTTPVGPRARAGGQGAGSSGSAKPSGATAPRSKHTHRHLARRRSRARQSSRGQRAVLARLSGTVVHATHGAVAIQVDRRSGKRWVAVERLTMGVGPKGGFGRLLRLRSSARYRVSAAYMGSSGYGPSRSGYRLVVVGSH